MSRDRERHQRVKALFLELCALPPDEQNTALDRACAEDDELRRELESLLEHHQESQADQAPAGRRDRAETERCRRVTRPVADSGFGAEVESLLGFAETPLRRRRATPGLSPGRSRFRIGRIINGRYQIVSELGRGGMGEVVKAYDLVLEQPVALKLLVEATPARLEQLINEVRLARRVTHANVCRVFDVGQVDNELFLSMEVVDGEDLRGLLRRAGRLPGDRALEIARQLCAGLAAAHAKDILHRDLKPSNVLIDSAGQVKITDFGIAESGEDAGRDGVVRGGTPAFMAPELLAGGGASVRSDLYALGLVLYEIATGRSAFDAESIDEYLRLHREVTPPSPVQLGADLHPELEAVIMRCLEKDPQKRPGSALEVAAALPGADPLQVALEVGATPPPELVAAARDDRGLRPAVALSCLAFTLLLLLAGFLLSDMANGFDRADLRLAPEVLAHQAAEMLADLGYPGDSEGNRRSGDTYRAYGFQQDVEAADLGLVERAVVFWYRRSDEPMVPIDMTNLLYSASCVDAYDPPLEVPGMLRLTLDPRGRLLQLEVVPEARRPPGPAAQPPDWQRLLRHAGLDPAELEPAEPRLQPTFFADTAVAWRGSLPGHSEGPIHVDAASLLGRPVFFDLQLLAGEDEGPDEELPASLQRFDLLMTLLDLVFVVLALAAIPMARRNLQRGRSDPRGARLLALVVGVVWLASWALEASHTLDPSVEVTFFSAALAVALLQAALVWLYYLALEPWVRRLWPHTLVSWSRLLRGSLHDRLVGRSLLLGSLLGAFWTVCAMLDRLAPRLLGLAPSPFPVDSDQLSAVVRGRDILATLLDLPIDAVYDGLFSLLLLLLLRLVLRRWWPAVIAYVLITGVLETLAGSAPQVSWLLLGIGVGVTGTYALVRFGLLTLITAFLVQSVLEAYPITLDLSAWYADSGLFALAVATLLAVTGFWLTRTGRA